MNVIDREVERRIRQKPNFQDITVFARAFESAVAKSGLHHCSKVFRFTIHYEKGGQKRVRSFFVKAPYGIRHYELVERYRLYAKEIYMYTFVFPLVKALLPDQSLQPEFYGTDGKEALILEDLTCSGYKLVDGHRQMDFEHSAVALKLLARFHAAGVRLRQTEPQIAAEAGAEHVMTSEMSLRTDICALYNARVEKIVRRAAPAYATRASRLWRFLGDHPSYLMEALVREFRADGYAFNVLNHGDFQTNNVMFADDEFGQVTSAKCLDFQSCRWSSPAVDVVHFCVTSVSPRIFDEYWPLLLDIYARTLNATLAYLKCEQRLDVDALAADIGRVNACWLHALVGEAPYVVADLRTAFDDIWSDEYLDDEYYVRLTEFWVPYFIEKGFFSEYEEAAAASDQYDRQSRDENPMKTSKNDEHEPDDHFLSGLVLLSFNARNSAFVKIPTSDQHLEQHPVGIHYREIFMFENVLPRIFEPWSGEHYAPLCHAITETKGLVLEDLESRGYRRRVGHKQLDLEHCRVALTTLAKYHALSANCARQASPALACALAEMPRYSPSMVAFGDDLYERFLRLAETLVPRSAHRRLRAYRGELEDAWQSLAGTDDVVGGAAFSVVAHGNFWTNNILFGYDERGRVRRAKMVDWQMSRLASPVLDLVYFFVASVPFDVFSVHRDALLDLYADTLNETLAALKCDGVYSRAHLDDDLGRYKALFPVFVGCILQLVMTERDRQPVGLQRSNEISCGQYPSVLARWLNYFAQNGIL